MIRGMIFSPMHTKLTLVDRVVWATLALDAGSIEKAMQFRQLSALPPRLISFIFHPYLHLGGGDGDCFRGISSGGT